MRAHGALTWHVIPGNHDADRQNGIWERVGRHGLPDNVRLHLEPAACPLGQDAWLLPAPLRRRQTLADPTAWMDDAETPEGAIRIGLAHGSVTHFGSADRGQGNYVDPARPRHAHLDYLALGDWHAQRQIGPHCWYAGTPEPDDFDQEDGAVLLVEIPAAGAAPTVRMPATPPTSESASRRKAGEPRSQDSDHAGRRLAAATEAFSPPGQRMCTSRATKPGPPTVRAGAISPIVTSAPRAAPGCPASTSRKRSKGNWRNTKKATSSTPAMGTPSTSSQRGSRGPSPVGGGLGDAWADAVMGSGRSRPARPSRRRRR